MNIARPLVVAGLLLLSSCGFKAPPVPPETVVPVAIADLRYSVDTDSTNFTWSYPTETISGIKIEEIDSFELFRAEIPLDEVCGNCPIPFREPEELPGGMVFDGEIPVKGSYQASALKSGYKYYFSLRSRLNWWAASADSNIASFTWFTPVEAVPNFVAQPGDGNISLKWDQVSSLSDGMPLNYPVKYQVQRSFNGSEFKDVGIPIELTSYTDERVDLGKEYIYRIQPLMSYQGELIPGLLSKEIISTPVDFVAPPTPKGLRLYYLDAGHKVVWDAVNVPDIKGYIVYSRDGDDGKWQEIARVAAPATAYTDERKLSSQSYVVVAIDDATPANESPMSREVRIR